MASLIALKHPERFIFWSAASAEDSDFTPEDPLALDYLAQQVGLWLFRGLTTRTSRAQNFAMVLYGLDLAHKACVEYGRPPDDDTIRTMFERWERFWALATLEYRNGELERGDVDAMRGIQGAKRAWRPGDRPVDLDFPLISRQSELGSLGAYLTSLREYRLVERGTLRPTAYAQDIISAFWDEPDSSTRTASYDKYALEVLDLSRTRADRKSGAITLWKIGERSRLSSIVELKRKPQQARLWSAIFENASDGTTLPISQLVLAANRAGVEQPRDFLEGAISGKWGVIGAELHERLELALAFGDVFVEMLDRFNAVYLAVTNAGWVANEASVIAEAFPVEAITKLQEKCRRLLSARFANSFRTLSVHGRAFLNSVTGLESATPAEALDILLSYHRSVQQERRRGTGWLSKDSGKIVIQLTSYFGANAAVRFPPLKINTVRSLLHDLGKQ